MLILCLSQPALGQGQAQWQLVVNGHFGGYSLALPIDSKPVALVAIFGYPGAHPGPGVQPITLSQDSVQGDGFNPETGKETVDFYEGHYVSSYSFTYTPRYEDTSICLIAATSLAPPYSQQVLVVATTYIAASNEYSLSGTDFGVLPAKDTSQAELFLFNQTPDTEWVSASFSKGIDFSFLEPASFPMMIPPGDTLAPIHLVYRADLVRLSSSDSIMISFQRMRSGIPYRSPISFGNVLTGRCQPKYCELSKTKFGYIASTDSSIGFLRVLNPTEDSETVSIGFTPKGDFRAAEGVEVPILIPPNDTTEPIPITMHTSINRKAIKDTLLLSLIWGSSGREVTHVILDTVLSGGCTAPRFSVDSAHNHFVSTLDKKVVDSIVVQNLTNDSLFLYTSFQHSYFDFNDYPYNNLNSESPQVIAPHTKAAEVLSFDPSIVGDQYGGLMLINWYFGTRDANDTADIINVSLEGLGLPPEDVLSANVMEPLSVYPNPSSGEFRVQGMSTGSFFVIYDVLGNPIFESSKGQSIWNGRDQFGNLCNAGRYFVAIMGHGHRDFIPILLVR